ncbi:MAG TPA: hypothetical protein VG796_17115 [Verrucomicrobiales bacterium]|nr:hypothetical protein [Verrucomicrobiales bacterium]
MGQDAIDHTAALVSAELERMKSMPVQEFAERMAEAWLSPKADPDMLLRRGLYLSVCDVERGMAFWKEQSRRQGLRLDENYKLQDLFQALGHRDGKRLMELMVQALPKGPYNGAAHGWASAAPREAVDWLNTLPESAPGYDSALQGIMWGLAENSPATALYAYERLRPQDQNYHTALNMTLSTVRNFGLKGLNELAMGAKDPAQRQLLLTSVLNHPSTNEPPAEFVRWMAGPLETAPYLRANFDKMASRWVAGAPDEAMAWLQQNAQQPGQDTALSIVAASLAGKGKGEALTAWLAENPNAPGQTAILNGMKDKPKGR